MKIIMMVTTMMMATIAFIAAIAFMNIMFASVGMVSAGMSLYSIQQVKKLLRTEVIETGNVQMAEY